MEQEVQYVVPDDPSLLREIMEVMRDAWSMPDYTEAVPAHVLKALIDNGGFVQAAIVGGRVVGFVMGFIGYNPQLGYYHYSHMLGVRKEFRGKNIALELKLRQRKWSLERGYKLIVWTYDPHQGLNARFNFGKLGVIARHFYENYYGEIQNGLNVGLPTDRFKVEWWVASKRVEKRVSGQDKPPSFDDVKDLAFMPVETRVESGARVPVKRKVDFERAIVLLEFPGDVNALKERCFKCALDWKITFREVVQAYLQRGYFVVEHVPLTEEGERRNFYLLYRGELNRILSGEYPWK